MPTVLLIRHAENDYVKQGRLAGRLPGVHLNDRGRAQAQALAEHLSGAPLKAVYSSPLDRTLETAAPIAAAHGLDVVAHPGLIELDFGDWENRTLKSLRRRKLWPVVQHRPSMLRFPNGESFAEAQQRGAGALESLCRAHKPRDLIACVSHSDLIKLLTAHYLGLSIDLFQRIMIAPASITSLIIGETHAQVMQVNYLVGMKFEPPPARKKKPPGKHKKR